MTSATATFEDVYEKHVSFVWRMLKRMGVGTSYLDDGVQDVFLVLHRRFDSFDVDKSPRALLASIAVKVAKDYRRRHQRKGQTEVLDENLVAASHGPHENAEQKQALTIAQRILETLDEDKRAVFILAELEGFTAPEMAEALSLKLNTVYSRLRSAKEAFHAAVHALKGVGA